ncbi:MAG: hypothetical protein M0Q23_02255 [Syntrophales bacterium]|jgi:hypothetical protein|nr:hypothetical protein [Syntrophales bacterium]MCK9527468.1 hypothetical protein [Syntrophales bacterium]MDX9922524.1 hypothetical protein [Syntrophales bacterium]
MMDGRSFFNKLWVIESLPVGDLKTGTRLVENHLERAKLEHPDLLVAFEQPITKCDFLNVLKRIRDEAKTGGINPMLHVECHGCPDGLSVASGEFVEWDELREVLIEINHSCRLNLVIVLAACNGAHLINVSTRMDRAPFWAIIGPEAEVKAGEIEKDFGAFYKTFFERFDGDAAINALNSGEARIERKYHFMSAQGLFIRAYTKYYKSHCIGKGRRERIEYLTTQAMQNLDVKRRGVNWARNKIKEGLDAEDAHFVKLKDRYFFIDCYPENAQRFPLSRDEILGKAKP